MIIDERQRLEAEVAAKAAADKEVSDKLVKDQKEKEEADRLAKEEADMPEMLRGKSKKEMADMMLSISAEIERERAKGKELEEKLLPSRRATPEEEKAIKEKAFFGDPTAFLDKHHQERIAPLQKATFDLQAGILKDRTRKLIDDREGAGEFEKHEKRIDEIMGIVPLEVKINPDAWEAVYNMAVGEEERKVRQEKRKTAGLHSETGGGGGTGEKGEKPLPKELADLGKDEIERAAARFGMKYEEYVEWAEKLEG